MHQHLLALQTEHDFRLEVLDIDADPVLQARYTTRVPVLAVGEQELCHYYLDLAGFLTYLYAI
jgi:thioredoxin reductase (NADPH)